MVSSYYPPVYIYILLVISALLAINIGRLALYYITKPVKIFHSILSIVLYFGDFILLAYEIFYTFELAGTDELPFGRDYRTGILFILFECIILIRIFVEILSYKNLKLGGRIFTTIFILYDVFIAIIIANAIPTLLRI